MPLTSVIIPVYNGERTIRETIESVLNQTLSDFELIVINDGSQDLTLDIIQAISDRRLQVFSYPNAGQAVSRNRGLGHASGEYISFLDADDLWTLNKLESQFRALQEHPQASVAYSWTDYVDESNRFLLQGKRSTLTGNVYKDLLTANFIENGSNPLIRKQALAEVGGFEPSLTPAEDWDLWLRLAACHLFIVVPHVQILYRVSATSSSANILRMETACLQVINRALIHGSDSLQHLKKPSLANLYKYLTCKALQKPLNRQKGLSAARFLWNYIRNSPSHLQLTNFTLILLVKVIVVILLPSSRSQVLLTNFNSRSFQSK